MVAAATAAVTATASVVAMQDRQDISAQYNQVELRASERTTVGDTASFLLISYGLREKESRFVRPNKDRVRHIF